MKIQLKYKKVIQNNWIAAEKIKTSEVQIPQRRKLSEVSQIFCVQLLSLWHIFFFLGCAERLRNQVEGDCHEITREFGHLSEQRRQILKAGVLSYAGMEKP